MAAPMVLVAGTALQMIGQFQANMAQAAAERENAAFYEAQRTLAVTAYGANLQREQLQYQFQKGRVISAAAAGGADVGAGSALLAQAAQTARHISAVGQIKEQSMLDIQLAGARARRARATSEMLASPGFNLMQAGTTALTSYAAYRGTQPGEVTTPVSRGPINIPSMNDPGVINVRPHYSPFLSATS